MKTSKFLKHIPGLFLISGILVFSSCENNRTDQRTIGTDDRDRVETTDDRTTDTYEMTEADYASRRDRVTSNIEMELNRTRADLENLRNRANDAPDAEREDINRQIDRLEARVERLENQQERLNEATMDNWEQAERETETLLQDRDGNVTGRDARTGTATGTEDSPDGTSSDREAATQEAQQEADRAERAGSIREGNEAGTTGEPGSGTRNGTGSGNVY